MKIVDLLFSDTSNMTVLKYIVFSQGFTSGFENKSDEDESSFSIRLGGAKAIFRGLIKYAAASLLVQHVMIDMTNIDDRGLLVASINYYVYGFFIYLQASLIGK